MSVELNEARRRTAVLRTQLTAAERDLSDVRHCLAGGQDASPPARRLGLSGPGLFDRAEDLRKVQAQKPRLAAQIEALEDQIRVAQQHVRDLEVAEPERKAREVAAAQAALAILPEFAHAGLAADAALKSFQAAHIAVKSAAAEMANLGHPVVGSEILRVSLTRVIETTLSGLDRSYVRSPGSSAYGTLAANWAENARRRLEAIVATESKTEEEAA